MPSALEAIAALSKASIIDAKYASNASQMATIWREASLPLFQVNVTAANAASRLQNFVTAANLSTALLGNSTESSDPFSFYAISLKADGSPVEVLNSDLSFSLLYGTNVSTSLLEATVSALQPFPRGLLTNIGMVVASAAYDSNVTDIAVSHIAFRSSTS
jgi:hypothetical protein